jgi:carboxylesterase type B
LGAFGWLAGHSVTANGTANAGLHDQRFGLDWVYKNIHLFGGDPERVTVMGVSAGGGSIMHQVTAYGGTRGPAPFQQAILQSPGWYPVPSEEQQEATLQEFLGVLNVNSVDEARQLPSDKLMAANSYQVARTDLYSTFTYGPVVDGTFVPKMPGKLLREGDYDHNLNIMVGHNSNEGILFTPPSSRNESNFGPDIRGYFPDITPNVVEYIVDVLYPPVYNGSQKYTTSVERMAQSIADVVFQCNTNYFNEAFDGDTYSYMFSIPPGFHGQDVSYTFYKGGNSSVVDPKVARAMQDYFTSFAQTGKPKSSVGPEFKRYGDESRLLNLGLLNITTIEDPTDNRRCLFWQQVPYYEE